LTSFGVAARETPPYRALIDTNWLLTAHIRVYAPHRVRRAGASGELTMRMDSGFWSAKTTTACRRHGIRYSITVRQTKPIRAAIATLDEASWAEIVYPEGGVAQVAETCYKGDRLIVRRTRLLGAQQQLFPTWRYHAFVTDRVGSAIELDADHRRHAVVEGREPTSPDEIALGSITLRGLGKQVGDTIMVAGPWGVDSARVVGRAVVNHGGWEIWSSPGTGGLVHPTFLAELPVSVWPQTFLVRLDPARDRDQAIARLRRDFPGAITVSGPPADVRNFQRASPICQPCSQRWWPWSPSAP
jgi:hypothetical protein